jgi:hypothetical protein
VDKVAQLLITLLEPDRQDSCSSPSWGRIVRTAAKHPYGGKLLTNRSAYKILHSEILKYLFFYYCLGREEVDIVMKMTNHSET